MTFFLKKLTFPLQPISFWKPMRLAGFAGEGNEDLSATEIVQPPTECPRERPTVEMLRQGMTEFEKHLVEIDPTSENLNATFDRADQLYVRFYAGLYGEEGKAYNDVSVEDRAYILNGLEELRTFLLYDFNKAELLCSLFNLAQSDGAICGTENEGTRKTLRSSPSRLLTRVLMRRKNTRLKEEERFVFGEGLRTRVGAELKNVQAGDSLAAILNQIKQGLSGDNDLERRLQDRVFCFLDKSALLDPHVRDLPEVLIQEALRVPSSEMCRLNLELAYLRHQNPEQLQQGRRVFETDEGGSSQVMALIAMLRTRIIELLQTNRLDPLTGFLNRKAWEEDAVSRECQRRRQTVIFMDLNGLKVVNEAVEAREVLDLQGNFLRGYLLGDYVLRQVGNSFSALIRGTDKIYRIGGDEFVILFPEHVSQERILAFVCRADRVLQEIESRLDLHTCRNFVDRNMPYKNGEKIPLGAGFAAAYYFPSDPSSSIPSERSCTVSGMVRDLDPLLEAAKTDRFGQARSLIERAALVLGDTITHHGPQRIPLRTPKDIPFFLDDVFKVLCRPKPLWVLRLLEGISRHL